MKTYFYTFCLVLCMTACSESRYEKYSSEFYDVFNTVTIVTGFEKSREDFDVHFSSINNEMQRLHKLYDIYNNYDGVNNAKTINDNAGIKPVKVDDDLIELIEFGKQAYYDTNGAVNIALGSVLKIWHECREKALDAPKYAAVPSIEELERANTKASIEDIIIDKEEGTVFLKNPEMSLDLGALAKGYAVGLAGKKARESGFESGIINSGGNIYTIGGPKNGRKRWNIGVQNPFSAYDGEQIFDALFINDASVVSSGNYQRFFIVDGRTYHHIIDAETLMPASRYSGVTVVHPDSSIADMLSTAAFILPQEEGKRLVEHFGGEAIWIYEDKSFAATDGYKEISGLYGITR